MPNKFNSSKLIYIIALTLEDLGKMIYFLGVELAYSTKSIFLNQRKYVLDLLLEVGKLGSCPYQTLIKANVKVSNHIGEFYPGIHWFQKIASKLIYLIIICPDITYAISLLSQVMHSLWLQHIDIMERILKYLRGCPCKGSWWLNLGTSTFLPLVAQITQDVTMTVGQHLATISLSTIALWYGVPSSKMSYPVLV